MFNSSLNFRQFSNIITSRILDGIFIGNYLPLEEQQYLKINQITHVVNCAAREIQVPDNLQVLKYYWNDDDSSIIVNLETIKEISAFVGKALKKGESVLFCCLNGQSRSLTALVSYLMFRFKWSLLKALQYINIFRQKVDISAIFLKQLIDFEKVDMSQSVISRNWNQISEDEEEILLQNTYLNSVQKANNENFTIQIKPKSQNQCRKRVSWSRYETNLNYNDVSINFSKEQKIVKSILKSKNTKVFDQNNTQSKAYKRFTIQKEKGRNEILFIRKNSQQQRNVQSRTLTPLNNTKIIELITLNKNIRNFFDIELQSKQFQRKAQSQTNTPRQNVKDLNNSFIQAENESEKYRKPHRLISRPQFKLFQLF